MLDKYFIKENVIEYTIIALIALVIVFLCWLDIKFSTNKTQEKQHECMNFVKYQEHYQITPLTWNYRDNFKCIECGKDYKD